MNIVVIGSGTVGAAISAQLAAEGHAITVVDNHYAAIAELQNACDVFGVEGNGADISICGRRGRKRPTC